MLIIAIVTLIIVTDASFGILGFVIGAAIEREKLANVLVKAIGKSRTSRRLQDQGLR